MMSPKEIEAACIRTRKRLYPTGLNPKPLPPKLACHMLELLDKFEQQRMLAVVVYDGTPPPAHEEDAQKLLRSVEELAAIGPHLGRRRAHRHPWKT